MMSDETKDAPRPIGSELVREDPSFADIVVQFVDGLDGRVKTMEHAVRAADFEALRVAAHQLKGSGGGYGYPTLTERAGILEQHAKRQSVDGCLFALEELKALCARVVVGPEE